MHTQTSSMFHPDVSGLGQSSVWQWHVCLPAGRQGLGADLMEHAGPPRPGRGAMK